LRRRIAAIAVLGSLALGGVAVRGIPPAWAQSKRYPAQPVDKDSEQATKSDLWNAAITPERHPYQELVRVASEKLAQRTEAATLDAIAKLDAAIRLLPREPDAYRLRGDAHFDRRAWAQCAADFTSADRYTQRGDEPPKVVMELHRRLGICLARAGKLADAEKTLAETAAAGNAPAEIWLRLGEVRIAMGKLDEAIAALRSALDSTEPPVQLIRFLLATAYDRARRPADALGEASEAVKIDRALGVLNNPVVPPIERGESDYMLGLAYSAEPPRPEWALAYFRRFLKTAPDSPWRRRAEEHIRDSKTAELPAFLIRAGTAPIDLEVARTAARRTMPQLRSCLAKAPLAVVEIEVSRSGPRTPASDRLRPRFFTPPDGVVVRRAVGELTDAELESIDRCLQPLATRIVFPAIKERDTFYRASFYVVAP
jgi:tetratricopeptide (TPR) repeat protein